jgi:gas vesicle protein
MRANSEQPLDEMTPSSGGGFTVGLLCGAALGAAVALLLAPKPGAELRRDVATTSDRLKRRAVQAYNGAIAPVDDLTSRAAGVVEDLAARSADALDAGRQVAESVGARARAQFERGH